MQPCWWGRLPTKIKDKTGKIDQSVWGKGKICVTYVMWTISYDHFVALNGIALYWDVFPFSLPHFYQWLWDCEMQLTATKGNIVKCIVGTLKRIYTKGTDTRLKYDFQPKKQLEHKMWSRSFKEKQWLLNLQKRNWQKWKSGRQIIK